MEMNYKQYIAFLICKERMGEIQAYALADKVFNMVGNN